MGIQADASTVIMKTLSNNKGISLVILIIVMTLIAILGASFVSLVGTKHRGFLYQLDSYRAFNITNAGLEYSIRAISDDVQDTNGSFFLNPSGISSTSFGGGSFTATYNYTGDLLSVNGTYGNSSKQLRLSNFRRYIDPLTLVYDPNVDLDNTNPFLARKPSVRDYSSWTGVYIPLINNSGSDITINRLDIIIPISWKYLQYVYFYSTASSYQIVYDYFLEGRFSMCGPATCWNWNGILLRAGGPGVSFPFNQPSYTMPTGVQRWCVLWFDRSTFTSPTQYQVTFYYTLAGVSRTSTIKFDL